MLDSEPHALQEIDSAAVEHSEQVDQIAESSAPTNLEYKEFERLVLQEIPFLRRIVRRWHTTAADAEDLVHDTLLRAFANHHRWRPDSELRPWLFTIMRNLFLGAQTRQKLANEVVQAFAVTNPPIRPDMQDDRLVLKDVARIVDRLPEIQRTALMLVAVHGQSHEAVAASLGISAAALRCHLTRARASIRQKANSFSQNTPFRPRFGGKGVAGGGWAESVRATC